MSSLSNYTFNKFDRITNDVTDTTQHNLQNTKFANYSLSSYFSESITNDNIKFATQQPNVNITGTIYLVSMYIPCTFTLTQSRSINFLNDYICITMFPPPFK